MIAQHHPISRTVFAVLVTGLALILTGCGVDQSGAPTDAEKLSAVVSFIVSASKAHGDAEAGRNEALRAIQIESKPCVAVKERSEWTCEIRTRPSGWDSSENWSVTYPDWNPWSTGLFVKMGDSWKLGAEIDQPHK